MDPAQQHASQLINGFWAAQVACAAAALSLPDHMAKGPATIELLAEATGAHAPSLHRLLRALASLGLCAQEPDGRFALTDAGQYLRAGVPGSVRGRALFTGDMLWKQFGDLTHQVKTGGRTQAVVSGADGFEILRNDPERLHAFQQAMAESSTLAARDAMRAYDFARFRRVLDLGGGYGGVLAELLAVHPGQTGAVFDLPFLEDGARAYLEHAGVARGEGAALGHGLLEGVQPLRIVPEDLDALGARAYLEHAGVAGRARFIGGNFFEAVPPRFDLVVMKFIVHDWGDEEAGVILAKAREAADQATTLVLLEQVVPDSIAATPEHQAVIRADLTMMGMGGKERTAEEYRALLAASGWRLGAVTPSGAAFSVIEAVPV